MTFAPLSKTPENQPVEVVHNSGANLSLVDQVAENPPVKLVLGSSQSHFLPTAALGRKQHWERLLYREPVIANV